MKERLYIGLIMAGLIFLPFTTNGQHKEENSTTTETLESSEHNTGHQADEAEGHKEEGFNAGDFIFDHIADGYEWHLITYKDNHISIPLPIIVFSKTKGLHVFMSNKLHHGHKDFNGFRYQLEGNYRHKVVEIMEDGSVQRPMLDLSITKDVFAIFVSIALMLWIFVSAGKMYKKRGIAPPKGIQSFIEPVIIFIRDDVAKPAIGEKDYERYMPYLLTLFFFILINNLMGLIPVIGGANVTGNIAVTLVLAVFTFLFTTFTGNRHYWKEIVNAPGVPVWLKVPLPLMPIIEIVGMFTKPFVLMIRLFANITAGHIVALGFYSLIFIFGNMEPAIGYGASVFTIIFTVFMSFLELLVAFIQAYVFTLLSSLYFGMARAEHH